MPLFFVLRYDFSAAATPHDFLCCHYAIFMPPTPPFSYASFAALCFAAYAYLIRSAPPLALMPMPPCHYVERYAICRRMLRDVAHRATLMMMPLRFFATPRMPLRAMPLLMLPRDIFDGMLMRTERICMWRVMMRHMRLMMPPCLPLIRLPRFRQ